MARISEASLEQIRDKVDIVELVREFIPSLKRDGRGFKACCPFHQEKTPSFKVNPEKQIFHCFGCQASGDAFKFLMLTEGLSFPEAVEKLAQRAGVRLEAREREFGPAEKERQALRGLLEFAKEHYHAQLKTLPEAETARRYLASRGLNAATIERFQLGYAPRGGTLMGAAARKGYKPEQLLKAGLAAQRDGRTREYFWGRVLFPILDARGETVGFGARVLGEGEPKYLNSPESVVFSKGRVLYGLHDALPKVRKERSCVLLEGYMDVLAAHQFGVSEACAPLGTALTEHHAALLKRHVERVTIVFDPDTAGLKAAVKGAELLLENGISVGVATVPEGLDPDELLQKRGAEAFQACLAAAEDLPAFQTRLLMSAKAGALSPEDKARIASRVLETVLKVQDEVLRSEWVRRLAEDLRVDEGALHLQLKKIPAARPDGRAPAARPMPAEAAPAPREERPAPLTVEERDVLVCVLRAPGLAASDETVAETDFTDERGRRVFLEMRRVLGRTEGHERWCDRLLEALEPGDAGLVRALLCDPREIADPARVVADIVGGLRKKRRLAEIEPVVDAGSVDPDIRAEYNRLIAELKGTRK